MALARYQFTVTDEEGNVVPQANVRVRVESEGQPLASLFSDRDGAVSLANPFQADSDGFAAFHCAGAAHQIEAYKDSFSRTWRYVGIGTAQELDADALGEQRESLASNRTYYVRTDGNDNNDGLADTSGGAFLTIQKAINVVANAINLNGFDVTIKVANGAYNANVVVSSPWVGDGDVTLEGNVVTPSSVTITRTSDFPIQVYNGGRLSIKGFKITVNTSGSALYASLGGNIDVTGLMEFGACAWSAALCDLRGLIRLRSNYTISGGGFWHLECDNMGQIVYQDSAITVTLSGTPAFVIGFAATYGLSNIRAIGVTFSGSATGPRYDASQNSVIYTGGGGANYFPGNSAGATATGAQYL